MLKIRPILFKYSRGVKHKQNLVVLGGGWAGYRLIKGLDLAIYNVTVISPSRSL
jgi:NADH dehydrogenase FAD-containing subunit